MPTFRKWQEIVDSQRVQMRSIYVAEGIVFTSLWERISSQVGIRIRVLSAGIAEWEPNGNNQQPLKRNNR